MTVYFTESTRDCEHLQQDLNRLVSGQMVKEIAEEVHCPEVHKY